ncbi:hypothetical protein V6N13_104760 [Hibiscus sabdariffa]|uniref:Uncharacterized protein n=1 Tax=Hibiscus sabdariffa TaxID=183260 RepID=A0ABR2SI35_9ROSI
MHPPFFWRWLRWWCESVVCFLPLGVPRPGLGSPSTRLSLSLYVDRGVARHAWLAAPLHGSLEGPRMGPCSFRLYLGFLLTTCGTSIGGYAPLPCWPMFSDLGLLARFLLLYLGVHRSPYAPVYVYVVSAWLSFGSLLCVCPAPSADPWALVPRCAICGALGASAQWLARTHA